MFLPEAPHGAAFLVHRHKKGRGGIFLKRSNIAGHLVLGPDVLVEEDDAADPTGVQHGFFLSGKAGAGNADHDHLADFFPQGRGEVVPRRGI